MPLAEDGRRFRDRRCPDYVHEVEVVVHDSGEWLLASGTVVRPSRSFSVRCSCGHETGKHKSEAVAVETFRTFHGDTPVLKVVPVVCTPRKSLRAQPASSFRRSSRYRPGPRALRSPLLASLCVGDHGAIRLTRGLLRRLRPMLTPQLG